MSSLVQKGASAFGKLIIVAALAVTFLVGMASVVYLSLQGSEVKVPDLVGKDFTASEDELASLGLRIKKRADRLSSEKPNTILEQLPKAGETVKTGQMILVVRSKFDPDAEADKPATLKQNDDEDDSEKIEELISDKPKANKKANSNTNKKKTSTTRDVIANTSSGDSSESNSNKSSDSNDNSSKSNKNSSTNPSNKSTAPTDTKKESDAKKPADTKKPAETDKPKPAKTPGGGDIRPRKTPSP